MLWAGLPSLSEELCQVELGDKRLEKRHRNVVEMLSAAPEKSFVQMSGSEAELKGLYRFFNHGAAEPQKLFAPHVAATVQRCAELGKVLVPHDTSGISLGGESRRGLGRLNDGGQGYYLHLSSALSAEGLRVPLGALRYEALVREEAPDQERKKRKWRDKAPQRESQRWWRGVQEVQGLFEGSGTELIHLMDREADDYELLATMLGAGVRFVVRLKFDRLLALSKEAGAQGAPRKVHEALAEAQVRLEREVELSARKRDRSTEKRKTHPARQRRTAHLAASAMRLSIRRPDNVSKVDPPLAPSITLNCVRVWEPNPPEGIEPLEWYLLTSEPIDSAENIARVIDYYRARWVAEEFFKALKSGCAIEKRRLECRDALLTALALSIPIAWRILLLRSLARTDPELSSSVVLSDLQIQILQRARPSLRLPDRPTIREALLAVAALGGHLKHNGEPGWIVIGRGFEKLLSLEEGWLLARYGDVSNC